MCVQQINLEFLKMNRNINESIMSDIKKIIKQHYGHLSPEMIADKVCNQIIPTLIELYFNKKPLQQSKSFFSLNTVIEDFKQNLHAGQQSKIQLLSKQSNQIPGYILKRIHKCLSLFIAIEIICRKQVKRGFQQIKRQSQEKIMIVTELLNTHHQIIIKKAISKFVENFLLKKEQLNALKCIEVLFNKKMRQSFQKIFKNGSLKQNNHTMIRNGIKFVEMIVNRKLRYSLKRIKQNQAFVNPWIKSFVHRAALNSPATMQTCLWRMQKYSNNKLKIYRFQTIIRKAFLTKIFTILMENKIEQETLKNEIENNHSLKKIKISTAKSNSQVISLVNTVETLLKLKQFENKMQCFQILQSIVDSSSISDQQQQTL